MSVPSLNRNDALVVVDVQRDFCPGGSLAVPEGDQVVPVLNRWIEAAQAGGARVIASRDWHPPGHTSFQQDGGQWPVHCVQHTEGAEFHPELKLPPAAEIVSKGMDPGKDQYSALSNSGLADELRRAGIQRLWVGGLAQDVCVLHTVLDARKAGFEVHLIRDATRPVDPEQGENALQQMQAAGAFIE